MLFAEASPFEFTILIDKSLQLVKVILVPGAYNPAAGLVAVV
jgi:hypothetical protein